ncbi:hypothetical protein Dimus_001699 [Dionaea muscipula]
MASDDEASEAPVSDNQRRDPVNAGSESILYVRRLDGNGVILGSFLRMCCCGFGVVLAVVVMDCGAMARRRRHWASDEPALGVPTSHLLTCLGQRLGSVGFAGGQRAGG